MKRVNEPIESSITFEYDMNKIIRKVYRVLKKKKNKKSFEERNYMRSEALRMTENLFKNESPNLLLILSNIEMI